MVCSRQKSDKQRVILSTKPKNSILNSAVYIIILRETLGCNSSLSSRCIKHGPLYLVKSNAKSLLLTINIHRKCILSSNTLSKRRLQKTLTRALTNVMRYSPTWVINKEDTEKQYQRYCMGLVQKGIFQTLKQPLQQTCPRNMITSGLTADPTPHIPRLVNAIDLMLGTYGGVRHCGIFYSTFP